MLFQDSTNQSLLSEKKFSKECVRTCVKETQDMENIEVTVDIITSYSSLPCAGAVGLLPGGE